ncbi:hypothetical protein [Burkholderia cepacia]|uniref:hypothetical protein n=1 Tax=Burkholderia cepacia TaxID=292 RepID=UPI002019CBEB|nr:hypothetical protein [Burkholderia cepacia]UQO37836.1 hypothetical protein L0Z22_19395 [Burkholderia cepacia]UQO52174.1 hypothetical protein L0Z05_25530 [Burkholderia cepacia]UQP06321.1 hypothetical protein L0Z01_02360 [Burkholderia cepacia]
MDLRTIALCASCLALAVSGIYYGAKFIKKKNYLLGIEFFVLATSASNFLLFNVTGSEVLYGIAHFFDAFSRGFGVPIVVTAGLMAVTHNYKPRAWQDVMWFSISIVGTFFIVTSKIMAGILPYFYVVMWGGMVVYLLYFFKELLRVDEKLNAVLLMIGIVSSSIIAGIYDFYKIPGDEVSVIFNFFFLALTSWAYLVAVLYYAYCALEREQGRRAGRVESGAGLSSASR